MSDSINILEVVTGAGTFSEYFIAWGFAALGLFLSWLLHIKGRNKDSDSTPRKFSLLFFLKDNILRIITSVLMIAIVMRFGSEIFGIESIIYSGFLAGFFLDKLSQKLKDITLNTR